MSDEPQILLAGIIVLAFFLLSFYQIAFRPAQIIMPDSLLVITTVAICFLFMGGGRR